VDTAQQKELLTMLKALSDEQRLTMVGMMGGTERTVGEMAVALGLTEPTISHHVSKLHAAGFLNLRMAGNQRFYMVNPRRMARFKAYAAEIDTLPTQPEREVSDNAWMDGLSLSMEDKKVLQDYTLNGKLTQLPLKEKKWLAVLRWVVSLFEHEVRYSEKQVNDIIRQIYPDYATIRRSLVEYGFMDRQPDGRLYWLMDDEQGG
jgi:hypothetical protein